MDFEFNPRIIKEKMCRQEFQEKYKNKLKNERFEKQRYAFDQKKGKLQKGKVTEILFKDRVQKRE